MIALRAEIDVSDFALNHSPALSTDSVPRGKDFTLY
jgi:hypothetical protein